MKVGQITALLSVTILTCGLAYPNARAAPVLDSAHFGRIEGVVIAADTELPLPRASVYLTTSELSAQSDSIGSFAFSAVPLGAHSIRVEYVGYQSAEQNGVTVTAGSVTEIQLQLQPRPIRSTGITVFSDIRADARRMPGSVARLSQEEMRRSPGAFQDVVRAITVLPSATAVSNLSNAIVVRGGNPMENGFYVDNIEIPDISHLSSQGSTGGPLTLINMNLVRDVQFQAGGFDASYGGKLSSVTEISLREGLRDRIHGSFNLSATGAVVEAEGPLSSRSAFLLSYRRSFLDRLIDEEDLNSLPRVGDFQGKVSVELSPRHSLSSVFLAGDGELSLTRKQAVWGISNYYGHWNLQSQAGGVNWNAAWTVDFTSQTSLGVTNRRYRYHYFETRSRRDFFNNNSTSTSIGLRNVNRWQLNGAHQLEFGLEARHLIDWHDYRYADDIGPFGTPIDELESRERVTSEQLALFASHAVTIGNRLTATLGLRLGHFTYTNHSHLAPRLGLLYRIGERTTIHTAGGIYYQHIPLSILSQNDSHRGLRDPTAYHTGIGIRHDLSDVSRVSLEFYYKRYAHMPLDPDQSILFILDEVIDLDGYYFLHHERLTDDGVAYARGLEASIQAQPSAGLHGLVAASLSRSRYRDMCCRWRDRILNTRYSLTMDGGWKFAGRFGASMNWNIVGGRPYTPFDWGLSSSTGHAVYDAQQLHAERLDDYHSLSVRFDVRLDVAGSQLDVYLGIWNAYDELNINGLFWNESLNRPMESYQLGRLIFLGVELDI